MEELSKDVLKVLLSDTRVKMLRKLERRPMTASELSRALEKHVTTIAEHLELLHRLELVERLERPGRKWVYYRLTDKGRGILHPYRRWVLAFIAGFFLLSFVALASYIDTTPENPLYPIERLREGFQILLSPDQKRVEFMVGIAEERLEEAKLVRQRGLRYRLLMEYELSMKDAAKQLEKLPETEREALVEKLIEGYSKSIAILRHMWIAEEEVRIERAINSSLLERERMVEQLELITGKPYPA